MQTGAPQAGQAPSAPAHKPKPAAPAPAHKPKPSAPAPAPAAPPLRKLYANKRVGECFDFGHYPQGPNGEIEPITWRVLQREADHLLVIAEQGLDCKWYHEQGCDVTWANCNMRHWLNLPFRSMAFDEQERKCILKTSIANNYGQKTDDYIFLFSVDEAGYLFSNDKIRRAKPTEYAVKNGVKPAKGCCHWWLRSCGAHDDRAAHVSADGSVHFYGERVTYNNRAVRPSLKLAL